jgi:hypothetical protein
MFQNLFHLFFRYTRKPLDKIIHARATFQVFKKGGHRNACATKYPSAAHYLRRAFDNWT